MTVKLVANNTPQYLSDDSENVRYITAVVQVRGDFANFQKDPLGELIMRYFERQVNGDRCNVAVTAISHDDEIRRSELVEEAIQKLNDSYELQEALDVIINCSDTRKVKI